MAEQPLALDEIDHRLKNFKESLFSVDGGHLRSVETFMVESDLGDEQTDEVEAFEVAAKLMCGNVDSLAEKIKVGIEREPESIHAWCNKGVYHVMRGEREAASAALTRVYELRKITASLIVARRDHAYWIAERVREKNHYLKAFEIFEGIMNNKDDRQVETLKPLVDRTAELYLKILVRFCRIHAFCKEESRGFFAQKLHRIVDILIHIWKSGIEEKELLFFIWLSEVYSNYQFKGVSSNEMERLAREIRHSITYEESLEEAEKHSVRLMHPKFLARAGKNWYYYATESRDRYEMACLKAIELCELSLETGAEIYMASDIIYKACMLLWAKKYYERCRSTAHSEYKEVMGGDDRIPPWQIQKFLTTGLFFVKVTETAGMKHLEKAHDTMKKVQEKHAQGLHKAAEFARLKYLLGKPDPEVVKMFEKALGSLPSLEESYRCETHLKFARFSEKSSNFNRAKEHYEDALKLARRQGRRLKEAEHRISFL